MDASQTCPKCGWAREPGAIECPACGIVYARYGGGPRPAASPETGAFGPPPLPSSGEAVNPYAPPQSNLQNTFGTPIGQMFAAAGVWRTGDLLVMQKGAVLPNRCLVCNQPASVQFPKKMYWHSPWVYVLILLNLFIYLIAALIARKKADVVLPLCGEHAEKRKRTATIGGVLVVASLVSMVGSFAVIDGEGPAFALMFSGGFLMLLVGAIMLSMANKIVPKKIDDYHVWLRKVSASYLAALPPAPPGL
jgi:hypothetical protein